MKPIRRIIGYIEKLKMKFKNIVFKLFAKVFRSFLVFLENFVGHTIKYMFIFFAIMIALSIFINVSMVLAAKKYVYKNIDEVPAKTTVLVLGAMTHGTRLSPVLHDRVSGGIHLLNDGRGQKLLLSGDHGKLYYDEVNAMKLYVLNNASHIAKENIFLDHAGFSTWDSIYRSKDVFEVKDLIIVTQEFHITRAVCIARSLGLDAVGYSLNQYRFSKTTVSIWNIREYFARIKAFFNIIFKPKPRFLGERIPITGDGQLSWD